MDKVEEFSIVDQLHSSSHYETKGSLNQVAWLGLKHAICLLSVFVEGTIEVCREEVYNSFVC